MKARDDNSCEAGMEQLLAFALENTTPALEYDGIDETRPKDENSMERLSDRERLERAKAAFEKPSGPFMEKARRIEESGLPFPFHELVELSIAFYDTGMVGNATNSAKKYFTPRREMGAGGPRARCPNPKRKRLITIELSLRNPRTVERLPHRSPRRGSFGF